MRDEVDSGRWAVDRRGRAIYCPVWRMNDKDLSVLLFSRDRVPTEGWSGSVE
jgi:hypothetical protein